MNAHNLQAHLEPMRTREELCLVSNSDGFSAPPALMSAVEAVSEAPLTTRAMTALSTFFKPRANSMPSQVPQPTPETVCLVAVLLLSCRLKAGVVLMLAPFFFNNAVSFISCTVICY